MRENGAHARCATGGRRISGGNRLGEELTVNGGRVTGNGESGRYGERDYTGGTRACR